MLSHVFVGITDFERALEFYSAVMAELGYEQRFCDRTRPWAGWHGAGGVRPLFVIAAPFDGQPHEPGNGQMLALLATSRAIVRAAHARALAMGGSNEGDPALRPHYHADYYGAYFRDPDSNKICVACHRSEDH